VTVGEGGLQQRPLADEARRARHADEAEAPDDEREREQREAAPEPGEALEAVVAHLRDERRGHQEERGLGDGVRAQVQQPGLEPLRGAQRERQREVAHLPDGRVGQQPAQAGLEDGGRGPGEHGQHGERHEQRAEVQRVEHVGHAEERHHHAHQLEVHDLGGRARQEGRHRVRGLRVGARQPLVQREDGELDAEAHGEERERHVHRAQLAHVADARGHLGGVQRAGHLVHEPDADEHEGAAQRAEEQVVERRREGAPLAAQGHQRVGGERRDLEEDEHVERVARDHHAHEAGHAHEEQGVEEDLAALQLIACAARAEADGHGGEGAHDDGHVGARVVDAQLDADGRAPAAERVADRRVEGERQRPRAEGADDARRRGDDAAGQRVLDEDHDGRREQRHQHHQDGEVRHHGPARSASGGVAVSRACASSTSRRSSSATTSSSVDP
jgi:hypothetical protein